MTSVDACHILKFRTIKAPKGRNIGNHGREPVERKIEI